MRFRTLTFLALFLIGLTTMVACARKSVLPAAHPESLAAERQFDCFECHEDQNKGTMKTAKAFSHSPAFVSNHRLYAGTDDRLCATCHKGSFCRDCHASKVDAAKPPNKHGSRPEREMPHRGDFMALHKIEGKLYPAGCYRCHGRDNNKQCTVCHR